jgi:hypothetical protein
VKLIGLSTFRLDMYILWLEGVERTSALTSDQRAHIQRHNTVTAALPLLRLAIKRPLEHATPLNHS